MARSRSSALQERKEKKITWRLDEDGIQNLRVLKKKWMNREHPLVSTITTTS